MTLDEATRRNLELTESIRGGTVQGSLLGVLDATLTPMGGREIRRRLSQPLLDVTEPDRRLDALTAWHDDARLPAPSCARSSAASATSNAGPTAASRASPFRGDLVGIREALARAERIDASGIGARITESRTESRTPTRLDPCADIASLLAAAITDEPPATLANSGVIRARLLGRTRRHPPGVAQRQELGRQPGAVERERTGIKSLKVGYNKVFGYYIEITTRQRGAHPADYIRKQTLVNAERYITPESEGVRVAGAQCRGAHPGAGGTAFPATAGADRGGGARGCWRPPRRSPSWTSRPRWPRSLSAQPLRAADHC